MYEQDLVKKESWSTKNDYEKLILLESFSQDLDKLSETGFVHGDLNLSNIIYDGYKLMLVDLEPSFKQIRYGKKVVMSAAPLRSLNDLRNSCISIETDKIGLYFICNIVMGSPINFKNMKNVIQKRRNGYEFLPIKESLYMKLTFLEIFKYFKNSILNK